MAAATQGRGEEGVCGARATVANTERSTTNASNRPQKASRRRFEGGWLVQKAVRRRPPATVKPISWRGEWRDQFQSDTSGLSDLRAAPGASAQVGRPRPAPR